jgi:hypothetical protein
MAVLLQALVLDPAHSLGLAASLLVDSAAPLLVGSAAPLAADSAVPVLVGSAASLAVGSAVPLLVGSATTLPVEGHPSPLHHLASPAAEVASYHQTL